MLRTFQNYIDKNKIQSSFVDDNRTMIEITIDGLLFIYLNFFFVFLCF